MAPPSIRSFPTSPSELSKAIKDDDKRFRRYAARTLKADIRRALSETTSNDAVTQLEARQVLGDYEMFVVPACITQIETHDVGPSCVTILGLLEAGSAFEALEQAQENSKLSRRHQKKIERAIEILDGQ